MSISFTINGKAADVEAEVDTPLLWVLREHLKIDWDEIRLRRRPMRRLHCAYRRQGDAFLSDRRLASCRQESHHYRRACAQRHTSVAKSLGRRAGAAMRLLPVRANHASRRAARHQQKADARAD